MARMAKNSEKIVIPGEWVTLAREQSNISQRKLAEMLDTTTTTVSQWENNKQKLFRISWFAVLMACGLPKDWEPNGGENAG